MNEALWSPNGSFTIVTYAPAADVFTGGQAKIVRFDGRPDITLMAFAQELKWGP